jgi:hypothetical protein
MRLKAAQSRSIRRLLGVMMAARLCVDRDMVDMVAARSCVDRDMVDVFADAGFTEDQRTRIDEGCSTKVA